MLVLRRPTSTTPTGAAVGSIATVGEATGGNDSFWKPCRISKAKRRHGLPSSALRRGESLLWVIRLHIGGASSVNLRLYYR
jgi:hypothetical protein